MVADFTESKGCSVFIVFLLVFAFGLSASRLFCCSLWPPWPSRRFSLGRLSDRFRLGRRSVVLLVRCSWECDFLRFSSFNKPFLRSRLTACGKASCLGFLILACLLQLRRIDPAPERVAVHVDQRDSLASPCPFRSQFDQVSRGRAIAWPQRHGDAPFAVGTERAIEPVIADATEGFLEGSHNVSDTDNQAL